MKTAHGILTLWILALLVLPFQNCHKSGWALSPNSWESLSQQLPLVTTSGASGKFVNARTGAPFTPRGVNYVRLDSDRRWHATFESNYSPQKIESAMIEIQNQGYNYVRVFLQTTTSDQGFGLTQPGLPADYIDRIADFIGRANSHKIYVLLTGGLSPGNYHSLIESIPSESDISFEWGNNYFFMHPGVALAQSRFYHDLFSGLKKRNPLLLDGVLAIDLWNEAFFQMDQAPLSASTGSATISGVRYDLANYTARQQMMNATAVKWFRTLRASIKQIAPNLLVTASLFSPKAVGRDRFDGGASGGTDQRMPMNPLSLVTSGNADLISIHLYAHPTSQFDSEMTSAGIAKNHALTVPLLMGEFGAFQPRFSIDIAKTALRDHLIKSCEYSFSGWGFWTWDTIEQIESGGRFWTATENGDSINKVIAPKFWSQICPSL